ncbi:sensor histidine kinase [Massilia sp. CF038]|uniref:sensor histidine kinase n=1 Tax=Massilia sp. CF038 TaxID=1881045 RepID=UPI00091B9742|nr:histidine kinase [Massilia sp. CF038]SHH45186.1 two-component system, LytT family, sensor histidine kinase AlgZ [Massilia sp. CF038]
MKIETPLLVPVLAALPVCACMAILGLPSYGHGHVVAFRSLFFVGCMAWLFPLALLQRAMWRREWPWLRMALVLLSASYAMSILNALMGQRLAISLGLETRYQWADLPRGLDGCWLALIAFCAVHAVAAYYLSLQRVHLHLAQAQSATRDAELRALRLQVNPHFLFNSLNAISALVSAQSNKEANRMIGCLADFLRTTLAHDGRHEHALADELALLDAYLAIEKARLGDRLRMTMKAGPDLLDSVVPYLVLQPLVENAIRHGIATLSTPGHLDILVARAGERLIIDVQNDGLQQTPAGNGIGLTNVRERLRHLYGDHQSVDASWRADGRFHVHISLPLHRIGAPA